MSGVGACVLCECMAPASTFSLGGAVPGGGGRGGRPRRAGHRPDESHRPQRAEGRRAPASGERCAAQRSAVTTYVGSAHGARRGAGRGVRFEALNPIRQLFEPRTEHGLSTVPRTLDWQWPAGPADGPFRVIMLHNHAFMRDACLLVRTPKRKCKFGKMPACVLPCVDLT